MRIYNRKEYVEVSNNVPVVGLCATGTTMSLLNQNNIVITVELKSLTVVDSFTGMNI
jgi:hypothetical protein